jgi:dienelactone hydrolase
MRSILKWLAITVAVFSLLAGGMTLAWPWIGAAIVLREYPHRELDFTSSDGVHFSGTLVVPPGPPNAGPYPVVVLVHGSGKSGRMTFLAAALASRGLAVYTYDKRGVGRSGGVYEPNNIRPENLRLLADDAAAALTAIAGQPDLRGRTLGYVGVSQAGWIIPQAASQTPQARFIAFWSGMACPVSEEMYFSAIADDDPHFWDTHSRAQVANYMNRTPRRRDDYDPVPVLATLGKPALYLFGGRDHIIPVDRSIAHLDALIAQGKPIEHRVFPGLEHDGYDETVLAALTNWILLTTGRPGS